MTTAATKATLLVTKDELLELADAEKKNREAKQKAAAAEKEVKLLRLQLAEKVLGINTEDELKALPPEKIAKLQTKRFEAGDWKAERGAPLFSFVKTHSGTYPAWAKLYASELGQVAASRITAATDPTYSYAVEVSVPA